MESRAKEPTSRIRVIFLRKAIGKVRNNIRNEIKDRFNSEYACYFSTPNSLSLRSPFISLKVKDLELQSLNSMPWEYIVTSTHGARQRPLKNKKYDRLFAG
jgi:hypothetical protein